MVLTREKAAVNYSRQRHYSNYSRKYLESGEPCVTPVINLKQVGSAVASYHNSRVKSAHRRFNSENPEMPATHWLE